MIKTHFINSTLAKYDDIDFAFLQTLLLEAGVFANSAGTLGLAVTQNSTPGMSVQVAVGKALVQITKSSKTFKVVVDSDSVVTVPITSNSTGVNRVDAIVVRVSTSLEPAIFKDNVGTIERVLGTGATALSDGAITTALGSDGWIRLANVTVANGATSILDASIASTRVLVVTNNAIRIKDNFIDTSTFATARFGGNGSDGALTVSSGTTNIDLGGARFVIKQYSSISITGTGAVTFSNPHAQGTTIIFKSKGDVTITTSAAIAIDVRNLGANGGGTASSGGSGYSGPRGCAGASVSGDGAFAGTGTINSNPNAGENAVGPLGAIEGGMFAGNVNAKGYRIPTGVNVSFGKVLPLCPGSGGSSGAGGAFAGGQQGGKGGGCLYIECNGAYINTGTINASAQAGTDLNASTGNAGHGGGAGTIVVIANVITTDTGTYTVNGGPGGVGTGGAGSGVAGANGYVYRGLNTEFV